MPCTAVTHRFAALTCVLAGLKLTENGWKMGKQPVSHNKLVRDRIPEIIRRDGRYPDVGYLDNSELEAHLKFKLIEECHELFRAESNSKLSEEIADILEILQKLAEIRAITWKDIEQVRRTRREERGGFDSKVFLYSVSDAKLYTRQRPKDVKGSLKPQLVTRESELSLLDLIKLEMAQADTCSIASAFYSAGMHNLLIETLKDFVNRGGKLRLLTSMMNYFNKPDDLNLLQTLVPDLELKIFYPSGNGNGEEITVNPPPFHLKCYLFEKPNTVNSLIIGSSNLTAGGLSRNYEWNYFSNSEVNVPLESTESAFERALAEFGRYWEEQSVDFAGDFEAQYRRR